LDDNKAAAEKYGLHPVTLSKRTAKLAKEPANSHHTKKERRVRYIDEDYLAKHYSVKPSLISRPPLPPANATPDELHQVIRERLDDLKQTLEHERAIARQLSQQNAQLLEQNQRLLEQVDDLTALTIRLGMNRKAPEQISVSDT